MREIVRSNKNSLQQHAAIDWDSDNQLIYHITLLQNEDNNDELAFNNSVEAMYKKWLMGEDCTYTANTKSILWNVEEKPIPDFLYEPEKNERLAKTAQRRIQAAYSASNSLLYDQQLSELIQKISVATEAETILTLTNEAREIEESIRNAVQKTKLQNPKQKWATDGLLNEAYLPLKSKLNQLFDSLKDNRTNVHHANYNLVAPKVEAFFALSKAPSHFSEARKELIALQKEVAALQMERWQKNELLDRIRAAFDNINASQEASRQLQDLKRSEQTEALQKQYELIIGQANSLPFAEAFALLKDLQDTTNKAQILRDSRSTFYSRLDEAFKAIKQKADSENSANYTIASKLVSLAVETSKQADLFKDARQILISAQNDLKEIRLGRQQKDELFAVLRSAFDQLNEEQEKFYAQKRQENAGRLEEALRNLKRIVARKKEGMEALYSAKQHAESKTSIIKVDKKSDGTIANQFLNRVKELTQKIEVAESDIAQLEKKIEKMEGELLKIHNKDV
jgi:hypothetical protein